MSCARAVEPLALLARGLLALMIAGCEPELIHVRWDITFAGDEKLAAKAAMITAWIARDGCMGSDHLYRFDLDKSGRGAEPEALEPGSYGFGAEAYDSACRPVAFGCSPRRLPEQTYAPIEIVLSPTDGAPRCAPEYCLKGSCSAPDARIDAGSERAKSGAPAGFDGAIADAASDASDLAVPAESFDASGDAVDSAILDLECPGGVRRPGGHCYRVSHQPEDFIAARDRCQAWNKEAKIVVLDDPAEEDWVVQAFRDTPDFWIGITDVSSEGTWLTELRVPATYFHWDLLNPDGSRNANCGRYYSTTGAWRDRSCFESNPVICELP